MCLPVKQLLNELMEQLNEAYKFPVGLDNHTIKIDCNKKPASIISLTG